jgi:tight adherence protein B
MMDPVTIAIFLGVLASLVVVMLALWWPAMQARKRERQRMQALRRRFAKEAETLDERMASVKRSQGNGNPTLDRLAARFIPRPAVLADRLQRTGYNVSLGAYVGGSLGLALVATLAMTVAAGLPLALGLLIGLIAGLGLPHFAVSFLIARRKKRFVALFPDGIDLIVRGVKSGLPITEGMKNVGTEIADPVGVEFRAITDAIRFGQTLEDALWETANRVDTPEFKFFVISLVIQSETGGNLGETLANLSDILRRRQQMKLKIKALASEARASATILGALPFIMVGILFLVSPDYITVLFTDTRGQFLGALGLVSVGVGIAVMAKLVRFEI